MTAVSLAVVILSVATGVVALVLIVAILYDQRRL